MLKGKRLKNYVDFFNFMCYYTYMGAWLSW